MTPEEIKKIAREYAEATIETNGFSADMLEELLEEQKYKAYSVLTHISQDYYIVPKSNVQEIYHQIKIELGDGGCSEYQDDINMEKENLLKGLFGKSLFEEEKGGDE